MSLREQIAKRRLLSQASDRQVFDDDSTLFTESSDPKALLRRRLEGRAQISAEFKLENLQQKLSPDLRKPNSRVTVLLVEDVAMSQKLQIMALRRGEYHCVCVSSGEEAMKVFQTNRYKIVLMDIGLPGMDGIETSKRMREFEATAGEDRRRSPAIIIGLTGTVTPKVLSDCQKKGGMNACIIKGKLLLDALNEALTALKESPYTFVNATDVQTDLLESKVIPGNDGQNPVRIKDSQRSKGLVLLVEDVRVSSKIAKRTLMKKGFIVDIATTGEQALDRFQKRAHDFILMDVNLPGISGVETTQRIRAMEAVDGRLRKIILALTGNNSTQNQLIYAEAGMDGCIAKGKDLGSSLHDGVNRIMKQRWNGEPATFITMV
jgi:CheY-like chemotaxis protein